MYNRPMKLALVVAVVCTSPAMAQQRAATQFRTNVPMPLHVDSLRTTLPPSSEPSVNRWHHARQGAAIGAATLGVLGAIVASSAMRTGCDVGAAGTPCHPNRSRGALALYGLGLGATAGAVAGGVIGFASPLRHTSTK